MHMQQPSPRRAQSSTAPLSLLPVEAPAGCASSVLLLLLPPQVNWTVMKEWVAKRVTELLGIEEEVLIFMIHNHLIDTVSVNLHGCCASISTNQGAPQHQHGLCVSAAFCVCL